MAFIDWTEDLSVGIASIDQEHKVLINMINVLHEAMLNRKGNEVLGTVVKEMVEYTKYHFGHEEELFKTHNYSQKLIHEKAHQNFTAKVLEVQKKLESKELVMSMEIADFLKDWLKKHIQGEDKKYSAFLIEKGVK